MLEIEDSLDNLIERIGKLPFYSELKRIKSKMPSLKGLASKEKQRIKEVFTLVRTDKDFFLLNKNKKISFLEIEIILDDFFKLGTPSMPPVKEKLISTGIFDGEIKYSSSIIDKSIYTSERCSCLYSILQQMTNSKIYPESKKKELILRCRMFHNLCYVLQDEIGRNSDIKNGVVVIAPLVKKRLSELQSVGEKIELERDRYCPSLKKTYRKFTLKNIFTRKAIRKSIGMFYV
jgi:hypothetical protein